MKKIILENKKENWLYILCIFSIEKYFDVLIICNKCIHLHKINSQKILLLLIY